MKIPGEIQGNGHLFHPWWESVHDFPPILAIPSWGWSHLLPCANWDAPPNTGTGHMGPCRRQWYSHFVYPAGNLSWKSMDFPRDDRKTQVVGFPCLCWFTAGYACESLEFVVTCVPSTPLAWSMESINNSLPRTHKMLQFFILTCVFPETSQIKGGNRSPNMSICLINV